MLFVTFLFIQAQLPNIEESFIIQTRNCIQKKLFKREYILIDLSTLVRFDEMFIDTDIIKLSKSDNLSEIEEDILILKDFKNLNSVFEAVKSFFNLEKVIGKKVLKISYKGSFIKNKSYFKRYFKSKSLYSEVIFENQSGENIFENQSGENIFTLKKYCENFNSHEQFEVSYVRIIKDKLLFLEMSLKDYDLKSLIFPIIKERSLKLTDFMCNRIELYICMMFYNDFDINLNVENDYKLILRPRKIRFLESLSIKLMDKGYIINNIKYALFGLNKKFFKIEKRDYDFVHLFIKVNNEILPSEYENIFYLFNSTRNTGIFDIVLHRLFKDENNGIFLNLIHVMSFISKDQLEILQINKTDTILYNKLVREIRSEVNNFIKEEVYKAFVILYWIKLDTILDKKLSKVFLTDKSILPEIMNSKTRICLKDLHLIKNRSQDINNLFSSELFYLMEYSLKFRPILGNIKIPLLREIIFKTNLIINGDSDNEIWSLSQEIDNVINKSY